MKIEKKKKESCLALEKKLDAIFSKYIRWKYSSEYEVQCYTCGKTLWTLDSQAGHYISRGHKATRFDEDNVRPQCAFCNCYRQGEAFLFRSHLVKEIGEVRVLDLEERACKITKHTAEWYHEKIKEYETKMLELGDKVL